VFPAEAVEQRFEAGYAADCHTDDIFRIGVKVRNTSFAPALSFSAVF
jgi:hypothetical protein